MKKMIFPIIKQLTQIMRGILSIFGIKIIFIVTNEHYEKSKSSI